ncbi:cilia- and flagella-associated protein 70 isoform X1 [Astyanax mexicanus]|uniref:cilia- and flagella-associated protein 70 isoform X1 n=1 Tax=Astyanax mexicanus TaxID=7994 RepID=UPI0020CABF71|nr:cilia- and flagella-associated protein 70 isoform X1 [Astyanax mexicanus]
MDTQQAAAGVPVQITVERGNNLRSNKSEPFLSFVRAEFNGTVLGDSQKLDVPLDDCVNFSFTCSFQCSETEHTLNDLAKEPVILTVTEVFPKEKKQKQDRTSVLGQAVLDLIPLLHGESRFSSTVTLHPVPESSTETSTQTGGVTPTLEVTVSVPELLLSDSQLSQSNLLSVTVETAYSVPDAWNPATLPPSIYTAALQIPLTAEKEQILLFSNGILKTGGERETAPRPKKWPLSPRLAPDAQPIPGVFIEREPTDFEDGDLTSVEDREFRAEAECNQKRVSWDTECRCFLDAGGAAGLTRRIAECRLWPLEVMKSPQAAKAAGGKSSKEKAQVDDEIQIPFHGVAYMDLTPLLYPGVKRIRGAYRLHPFYDSELQTKTKRTMSVLRESLKTSAAPPRLRRSSSAASYKAAAGKKTVNQVKVSQTENITDAEPQVNTEGEMYADSGSYIIIEITLEKPLVPKRPLEELANRVKELIPPRPALPRRPAGAERAVREYQAQIESVASQVLDQYQQMFGAAFVPGAEPLDPATTEQRKSRIYGELNCSGKYFAFKEQMKYAVVRIVREKMLRTKAFIDPEQLQAFLSQLYVFLVDEMHAALNKTLSANGEEVQAQTLLDCCQLKHFAREAQLNEDYQLAAHYYQERLSQDQSPSHWFDYGAFHMLMADYLKAEECFQTAVAIHQEHVPSLLMCGILAEMSRRYRDAETFLERATSIEPSSVVAWTVFGLFYLAQENPIRAEMAFLKATKLQAALTRLPEVDSTQTQVEGGQGQEVGDSESLSNTPALGDRTEEHRSSTIQEVKTGQGYAADSDTEHPVVHQPFTRPNTTIYMEAVKFLLENNALQMAQRALAQELLCPDGGPSSWYYLSLAHLQFLQGQYSSAEISLQEALTDHFQNPDAWALCGHLYYLMKDNKQAVKCYERTLDFVTDSSDPHPVYLRLASIYLQNREYEKAKSTYLRACRSSPSCRTWLGLGISCYRLGEMTEAEDALAEANILNNQNPEVWAYLALVCLQTGRKLEAEQSYKYTLQCKLSDEALLQEIRQLQERFGFGNPCFP